MIAVALNNSSKESWRQNQRTNDTILFTAVFPFFGVYLSWGKTIEGRRRLSPSKRRVAHSLHLGSDELIKAHSRRGTDCGQLSPKRQPNRPINGLGKMRFEGGEAPSKGGEQQNHCNRLTIQ